MRSIEMIEMKDISQIIQHFECTPIDSKDSYFSVNYDPIMTNVESYLRYHLGNFYVLAAGIKNEYGMFESIMYFKTPMPTSNLNSYELLAITNFSKSIHYLNEDFIKENLFDYTRIQLIVNMENISFIEEIDTEGFIEELSFFDENSQRTYCQYVKLIGESVNESK